MYLAEGPRAFKYHYQDEFCHRAVIGCHENVIADRMSCKCQSIFQNCHGGCHGNVMGWKQWEAPEIVIELSSAPFVGRQNLS